MPRGQKQQSMEKRVSPKWSLGGRVRKVSSLSLSVEAASLCKRMEFGGKNPGSCKPCQLDKSQKRTGR